MENRKPRARKRNVTESNKGIKRRGEGLSKETENIAEEIGESDDRRDDGVDEDISRSGSPAGGRGVISDDAVKQAAVAGAKILAGAAAKKAKSRNSANDPYGVSAREDGDAPSHSEGVPPQGGGSGFGGGVDFGAGSAEASMQSGRKRSRLGCILTIIIVLVALYAVNRLMSGISSAMTQNIETISQGNGYQTGWTVSDTSATETSATADTGVSSSAREKFTKIKGNGEDVVTIMVYMCGADLESKSGMATSDLNEMLNSEVGGNVNLIIYTGGCKKWRNSVISSRYNQIYQIKDGQLIRLVDNAGTGAMTSNSTLLEFLNWGKENFPANRYDLIFWDHGTGSLYGYGYDEKNESSGQMSLEAIDRALTSSGIKFDFVGFDACLMATAETALMLGDNADYLIASEEVEPGVGWYYTNWLTKLAGNTSMPTLEIGQNIVDDFVAACKKQTPGQSTTLSVTDLAELSQTLPSKMKTFSNSTTDLIDNGDFSSVSKARSSSKEFARGQGLDQVDLVHFAKILGTDEGEELADTILSAVKYNKTSSDVANAYGLSVYFPYSSTRFVDVATVIYQAIGMDESYSKFITRFAQYQVSGQSTSGGSSDPFYSLFGGYGGQSSQQSSQYSDYGSMDYSEMQALLELLMGGRAKIPELGIDGLTDDNTEFLSSDDADVTAIAQLVSENRLTQEDVTWVGESTEDYCLDISEEKWANISMVDRATFLDDGEGYIDLGLDNDYTFNGNKMVPELDGTILAIDGQPVAYYHTETLDISDDDYSIRGYVPCLLNGQRAKLIIVFDQENEYGYVAGASYEYDDTEAVPKNLEGLNKGDKIEFIATCYNYDGSVDDDYVISDEMTIDDPDKIELSNVDITEDGIVKVLYRLKDIFGATYWTESVTLD